MTSSPASKLSSDFWRLWAAAATSNLGDGIRVTALPLLIAAITRDPIIVSGVTVATFLPWIVASLPAGAIVDRIDRRRLMVAGQTLRFVVAGLLGAAILVDFESVALIYVTAFTIGLGEVFVDTSSQAAIPMLVDEPNLESANSKLLAVEFVANDAVGGPIGAWMFALAPALPFVVDSATFLAGAILISRIDAPLQEPPQGPARSMREAIAEGIAFVRGHELLRGVALAVAAANFAMGAGGSILVLLALDILGLSELGFGFLVAVGAMGGFTGAVAARWIATRLGRRWTMAGGVGLLAVGQLTLGLAGSGAVAATGFFIGSFGVSIFSVVGRSLRQAVTPDRLLGRVITVFRLVGVGAVPIGALLAGITADAFGIRVPYLAGALIVTGVAIAVYRVVTEERVGLALLGRSR